MKVLVRVTSHRDTWYAHCKGLLINQQVRGLQETPHCCSRLRIRKGLLGATSRIPRPYAYRKRCDVRLRWPTVGSGGNAGLVTLFTSARFDFASAGARSVVTPAQCLQTASLSALRRRTYEVLGRHHPGTSHPSIMEAAASGTRCSILQRLAWPLQQQHAPTAPRPTQTWLPLSAPPQHPRGRSLALRRLDALPERPIQPVWRTHAGHLDATGQTSRRDLPRTASGPSEQKLGW